MQVGVGVHQGQRLQHGLPHASLVDEAHVENLQVLRMDQALFAGVDAANADFTHRLRSNRRHGASQPRQLQRTQAAQTSQRHAMQVAARCQFAGVEIRMGIEPQHPQRLAGIPAVAGHRADRTDRQAMVTPQHDGEAGLQQLSQHRVMHAAVPDRHFGQVPVALFWHPVRICRALQVAQVMHDQALTLQRATDAGHAHRFRAHRGTPPAGANVGRYADQADVAASHASAFWPRQVHAVSPQQTGTRR